MNLCSRHYPFSHRRYAMVYPWSVSSPSFTNFNAYWTGPPSGFSSASPSNTIRLGSDAFDDLTGMLKPGMTANEKKTPVDGYALWYELTDLTPAAIAPWTIGTTNKYLRLIIRPHFQSISAVSPNTRPQRRIHTHAYAIFANYLAFLTATDGGFGSYTVSVSGTWKAIPSSSGDYTIVDAAIPTVRKCCDPSHVELTATYSSTSPSSGTSGSGPSAVTTYMDGLASTVASELSTAVIAPVFRMAAAPYGVAHSVENSNGADSLENWVPVKF